MIKNRYAPECQHSQENMVADVPDGFRLRPSFGGKDGFVLDWQREIGMGRIAGNYVVPNLRLERGVMNRSGRFILGNKRQGVGV